ncbi:BA75_03023T0 [Komagataella pastoris]|uniref:BA75_03023T0 n=1 Tax=Komagataella pastoris TaxID=4922 RepID=A0A1B2JCV5_PICPA|nr:BA75_03023T0 [Komagataella pastoris]
MESTAEASISDVKSYLAQLTQTLQAEQAATADVEAKLKQLCEAHDLDYEGIANQLGQDSKQTSHYSNAPMQIEPETEAERLKRENEVLLINFQRNDCISDKLEGLLEDNKNLLTLVKDSVTDMKSTLGKSEEKGDKLYRDRLRSFDETIHTLNQKLKECRIGYNSLERKLETSVHLHTMCLSELPDQ